MGMNERGLVLNISKTFSLWDLLAVFVVLGIFALCAQAAHLMHGVIPQGLSHEVSLDVSNLPYYSLLTTFRMLIGLVCAIIFSVIYATIAAKVKSLNAILLSTLDILQSVPVLGYLSFAFVWVTSMFPGERIGLEIVAIFAIFTAQAWNLTYSFYQSIQAVPKELHDAATIFGLNPWQRFWAIEFPAAVPGLVWNAMVSMSGAWFFIVASEALTIGNSAYYLPGIGSYISSAIHSMDTMAIYYAIGAMLVTIVLYDQILIRPLGEWSQKFTNNTDNRSGWCLRLVKKPRVLDYILAPFMYVCCLLYRIPSSKLPEQEKKSLHVAFVVAYYGVAIMLLIGIAMHTWTALGQHLTLQHFKECFYLGFLTLLRIIVMMTIVILFWVPVGIYIGLNATLARWMQPVIQILAAFPSNLLYPIFVLAIVNFHLNPNIWLSPLIVFGTQWYILFNVISCTMAFPSDLREYIANFKIKGFTWLRKVMLPAIFPYFMTGLVTAWGGAWNATIVAEIVEWGHTEYEAKGLGSYITKATETGDYVSVTAGIMVMVIFVVIFNRVFWSPLFRLADTKYKME